MRYLLLGLLLFGAPQDFDDLVERLGSDTIMERDDAADELVKLGPRAVAELKKRLPDLEGEVKARVEDILKEIEKTDKLNRILPPIKPVTLKAENKKVSEVLAEFQSKVDFPMDLKSAGDKEISVDVKDAAPFEALDAICKAADLSYRIREDQEYDFKAKKWVKKPLQAKFSSGYTDAPRFYKRHYRVVPTSISLNKTSNFGGRDQSGGSLQLALQWLPSLDPKGGVTFFVTEVVDDQGETVYSSEGKRRNNFNRIHRGGSERQATTQVSFEYPKEGVRALASAKGRVEIQFPSEKKILSWDAPGESVGTVREIEGVKIELKDFDVDGKTVKVKIKTTGEWNRRGARKRSSFGGNLPFSNDDINVIAEDGTKLRHFGMSGSGGGGSYQYELTYRLEKGSVKKIEIECQLDFLVDEFDFELKNIKLPK